jgi:hypothetical protein
MIAMGEPCRSATVRRIDRAASAVAERGGFTINRSVDTCIIWQLAACGRRAALRCVIRRTNHQPRNLRPDAEAMPAQVTVPAVALGEVRSWPAATA